MYSLTVKSKVFQILTYIRHKRPNERYRNTVKDSFVYRIPLPRRKPHTAGLDDTAIPHIKIKITEIPLEKKKNSILQYNTVNPMSPSAVGNVYVGVLLTESNSRNLFQCTELDLLRILWSTKTITMQGAVTSTLSNFLFIQWASPSSCDPYRGRGGGG